MVKSKINYTQDTKNIWFPDQQEPVYDPSDFIANYQFIEYWKREKDRMINGVEICPGVRISGWLYWHTVYWKIKLKKKLPNGRTVPVVETPTLRDIDWEADVNFERAYNEGKFIELVGSRGFGKTVWQSSRAAWYYTLINRSQVVVSAGNKGDIKTVTDMIAQGLNMIHPVLKKKRLKNDWSNEIQAGFKEADGTESDKSSFSQIIMRNYRDGVASMAINGTRPDFHIIDEIGKIKNFIGCVKDSDGSYWATDEEAVEGALIKPTCLPMYTGTGGDMEVGAESAEIFFSPRGYNILEFEDKWEGRPGPIGWFMPVTKARKEYKFPQPLSKFLGIEDERLDKITILVSDEELCLKEWWEPKHQEAVKSGNSKNILKFKAYWPLVPSDSFIVLSHNDFNTESAKAQKDRLIAVGDWGSPVELYHDGEKIMHKFSDLLPITDFPTKREDKNAPIQIYEFPPSDPPFGLYVAGIDPYRQGEAEYSTSLGVVYIFKRIHDITSEKWQNRIVAVYAARPSVKKTWDEQARLLIKYYNARALCENDEMSFIDYMLSKGDGHYLEDQPEWIREIVPGTTVKRPKGVHRSALALREFFDGVYRQYMDEIIYTERDEKGSIIKEVSGVTRIPDPMLLEETIKFNKKEGNFDRIVAVELALALAKKLDPVIVVSDLERDSRMQSYLKRAGRLARTSIVDRSERNLFKTRANKLFR